MNQDEKNKPVEMYGQQGNEFFQQEEERRHFLDILMTFFNYKNDTLKDIIKQQLDFEKIGEDINFLNFDYRDRIKKLHTANEINYRFIMAICEQYINQAREHLKLQSEQEFEVPFQIINPNNISKLRSTLKSFVRDWAVEGQQERDMCYKPIIEEIKKYFPSYMKENQKRVKILIPGAGLGRLAFDFASMGYASQGNEFSYFMLIASDLILNNCQQAFEFEIQPYIHNFCNNFTEDSSFQLIKVPDVNPYDLIDPNNSDFSMVAGEFVEVYSPQKGEWDSIVTCFFIDTANNIVQYIKVIYNCLIQGGVWVNMGPLQYHYADCPNDLSIELSWDQVEKVIINVGFTIKNIEIRKCTYTNTRKQMMNISYDCVFFTAIKES